MTNKMFRSLFDDSNVPVAVVDLNGRLMYANRALADLCGYSIEDLLGRPFRDFLHPEDADRVTELLTEAISSARQREEIEFRAIRKDGRVLRVSSRPTRLEAGNITVGFQAIILDITEHKQMTEQIQSLARFPSENPNPVLRLDRDGVVLDANQASARLLHEWGSEIGQTAPKLWCDLAADVLATGLRRNVDVEFSGRVYTFFAKPVMDAGYVNLYGREITERRLAEDALRESEERYRLLFRSHLSVLGYHRLMERSFLPMKPCEPYRVLD
jgi:two-component system CheB/CheR fusion protein